MDDIELRFYVHLSNSYKLTDICQRLMQVCSGTSFTTALVNNNMCVVIVVIPYTQEIVTCVEYFYLMCLQIIGINKFVIPKSFLKNISLNVLH